MDGAYLITRMQGRIFSFLLHGQNAVEIHCDAPQKEFVLGNIYVGKVKNIAKNIGAAFVELKPGVAGYLALEDLKCPVYTKKGTSKLLQAGDELLVQIAREEIRAKRISVTTNLTLHGKYVLLTMGRGGNNVSSRLDRAQKKRLLSLAEQRSAGGTVPGSGLEPACGWLFRTNAKGAPDELLVGEMDRLREAYAQLMAQAQYRTCFSCVYRMPQPYLLRLANLYDSEAERFLTDDEELYGEIKQYLETHQREDLGKLSLYQDELLPMKKLYSLEHQLTLALQERVWLKSGGYLVIQPTEALTVIDVNTGKYEGGKKREAAFLKINQEAAAEIARQLRLRNLSGIIIVDFINMEESGSREQLLAFLDGELRRDPVRTSLVDMTKLSLVEITRMKKERPLAECVSRDRLRADAAS